MKLLGGNLSLAQLVSDMNKNLTELMGRGVTEIFKDATGTRRVLLGKGPLGYGLYVSPEGVDVYTADASQLIFNSGQNVFKVIEKRTTNITIGSGEGTLSTVAHGLSFTPSVVAYLNQVDIGAVTDANLLLPTWFDLDVDSANNRIDFRGWISCYVDDTNVYFHAFNSTGVSPGTFPITYYLLQETAV